MVESDTIKLLRECDAGIIMGVDSIDDVLSHVKDERLKRTLETCKEEHEKLKEKLQEQLADYQDDGKNPNPVAKGMSWMKTMGKMMMDDSDATIADLMTDGSNMGVKSLSRYLNQYAAADEDSKNITKDLIQLEEKLSVDMRAYL
ncbi:MAG: hypothetical protein E7402_04150 [Ruminococcaceae bacterium]|nr:hypothetical protein [Oscillospiraceae bacterium]